MLVAEDHWQSCRHGFDGMPGSVGQPIQEDILVKIRS